MKHKSNLPLHLLCALLACLPLRGWGQDPKVTRITPLQTIEPLPEYTMHGNISATPVKVGDAMPASFSGTLSNTLERGYRLYPFFERLARHDVPVRVVHIGDSHVRGHIFTVEARRCLEQAWGGEAVLPDSITYQTSALAVESGAPGLVYHTLGINGATVSHFMQPDKLETIAGLHPDLIILSFGTNESHAPRYSEQEHRLQLDSLLYALHSRCPRAEVMLTTPPGSYIRKRRRGPRVINQLTPRVVETLQQFAADNDLPLWDMYHIVGGKQHACLNWTGGNYMQRDRVHYTRNGYLLQGDLLAEAILKSFNEYVADRLE